MERTNLPDELERRTNFRILLGINILAWMIAIGGSYCGIVQQQGSISKANTYITSSLRDDFKGLEKAPFYALTP